MQVELMEDGFIRGAAFSLGLFRRHAIRSGVLGERDRKAITLR
jgi:hypothetical protein